MGVQILWLQLQISVAVVVILLLRRAMRKMPKIYSYLLWMLVFLRLLCPVNLETGFSFMPSVEESSAWVVQMLGSVFGENEGLAEALSNVGGTAVGIEGANGAGKPGDSALADVGKLSGTMSQPDGAVSEADGALSEIFSQIGATPSETLSQTNGAVPGILPETDDTEAGGVAEAGGETKSGGTVKEWLLLLVWGIGAITVLGYNGVALVRVRRKLRGARFLQLETESIAPVYLCEHIHSPFTLGILQPNIYLPANLAPTEQAYILMHEQVHIRRKDYLVKNLAFLLTAGYWFNPFVWVAFICLERDMEMSCDEKVIRLMGEDIKRGYSQSLLNFAVGKDSRAVTPLTFGENGVKQRVKNVLTYQNAKKWSVAVGAVLLLVGAVALFTTGEGSETQSGEEQVQANATGTTDGNTQSDTTGQPDGNTQTGTPDGNAVITSDIYWAEEAVIQQDGEEKKVTVQARKDGIYRVDGDVMECLYPYSISSTELFDIHEGILYYLADTSYREGDLTYLADGIIMIDIKTGQYDSKTLFMSDAYEMLGGADEMTVGSGYIRLHDKYQDKTRSISLVNTGENAILTGNYWQGKAVSELSEQEQNQYGAVIRQQLLEEGQILRLSNRVRKETFAIVDLDGDGEAERITLSRNPEPLTDLYWSYEKFDKFKLDVDGSALTGELTALGNDIFSFSPDGKNIVLALSAGGENAEYRTLLYSYAGGSLQELGILPCHISDCTLADEVIAGWVRSEEFMQPCWILKKWCINKEGQLEEVLQDSYELFYSRNKPPKLLVVLPVHDTPGGEEIHYIQPQNVDFVRINNDFLWIYLEAEDGSSGWFQVEMNLVVQEGATVRTTDIVELDMDQTEVFELFYAG